MTWKAKLGSVVVLMVLGGLAYVSSPYWTERTIDPFTVTKTYVKAYDGVDTYIVVDQYGNAYKDVDTWLYFKFNSTDVYNKLVVNKSFKVKVYGWRIPFFSSYPNIISVDQTQVENNPQEK